MISPTSPPSPEPEGETNAAPVNDLRGRLEAAGATGLDLSPGDPLCREAAAALEQSERRVEELKELLVEALAGWEDFGKAAVMVPDWPGWERIAALRKAAGP